MKETFKHTANAMKSAKKSGGVRNVKFTDSGVQYTYKDGTGYYIDNKKKNN